MEFFRFLSHKGTEYTKAQRRDQGLANNHTPQSLSFVSSSFASLRLCVRSFPIIFCAIMLLAGCVSLTERAGRALDGSAFAERAVSVYRDGKRGKHVIEIQIVENKALESSVIIMLGQFPAMRLRGSMPDINGEFHFISLDYLGGSPHGWNEFSMDLFGSGLLFFDGTAARLTVPETVETVGISSGRIRRFDTRITGTEALTGLRNRHERINALAQWMNAQENAAQGLLIDDFSKYWKPLLFPELVRKKQRPPAWQQENDLFARAESINWNTGYTERVFPELLWNIRNTGTMLRDWEEALDWLYLEYEWNRTMGKLSHEISVPRAKR